MVSDIRKREDDERQEGRAVSVFKIFSKGFFEYGLKRV